MAGQFYICVPVSDLKSLKYRNYNKNVIKLNTIMTELGPQNKKTSKTYLVCCLSLVTLLFHSNGTPVIRPSEIKPIERISN